MSIQNSQSNKCENCARYNKTSFVEGYCDLYNFYVPYSHNCLNFEEKRLKISMTSSNKLCMYCTAYNKGYCEHHNIDVSEYDEACDNFSKKKLGIAEEKTLLCDNCRFAEYKDNNDSFYCALYDQPIYAYPHHLVCDHHSDHYKGFDSPRYVR